MSKKPGQSGADKLAEYDKSMGTAGRLVDLDKLGSQLSCGLELSKKILIGINVFFLILGAVVIGLGAYTMNSEAAIAYSKALPTGIIVLGAFILVLSFLGCFGALRESRLVLIIYAGILGAIFFCQLVMAAIVLSDTNKVEQYMINAWIGASPATQASLESDFNCCGLQSFNDTNAVQPCPSTATQGCLQSLESSLQSRLSLLGGFGIFLAIVQLCGVVLAIVLRSGLGGSYSFGTR